MTLKMLGWYLGVLHAEADQLESFNIDEIACKMAAQSPYVWDLWGALLAADPGTERQRLQRLLKKQEKGSKQEKKEMLPKGLEDEDEDEFLFDNDNDIEVGNGTGNAANLVPVQRRKELLKIVSHSINVEMGLTSVTREQSC